MFDALTFKVADEEERQLALELRTVVYTADLGHVPDDGLDESAHHLVVRVTDGPVVAAVRIVGPEKRPFDFEMLCDLGSLLSPARRPALIGRLCVRRDYRTARRSTFIHVGLLRLAIDFGHQRGFTDYFLYTYPSLIRFYRGALFECVGDPFEHPDWGQISLMRLDLLPETAAMAMRSRLGRRFAPS